MIPQPLQPQATTVPSDLSAKLWSPPAAMAITSESPAGLLAWPSAFDPQPTTVPSDLSAKLWLLPPATAITSERPEGTAACWKKLSPPQALTVPFDCNARSWRLPAAIATAERSAGTVVKPQPTTGPSGLIARPCSSPAAIAFTWP